MNINKYLQEQRLIPVLLEQGLINEELDMMDDYLIRGYELENA